MTSEAALQSHLFGQRVHAIMADDNVEFRPFVNQPLPPTDDSNAEEEQPRLNSRGKQYIPPYVNPITHVMRQSRGTMSRDEAAAALRLGISSEAEATNNENYTICMLIAPKRKGWCWHKRTGAPLNFADPVNTTALINWACRQSFWENEFENGLTVQATHNKIALDAAEKNVNRYQVAKIIRDLIAHAIRDSKPCPTATTTTTNTTLTPGQDPMQTSDSSRLPPGQ